MPDVLCQLMRHRTVEMTMKFYVGNNAELVADADSAAVGDTRLDRREDEAQCRCRIAGKTRQFKRRAWESNPQPLSRHLISSRPIVIRFTSVALQLPVFQGLPKTVTSPEKPFDARFW